MTRKVVRAALLALIALVAAAALLGKFVTLEEAAVLGDAKVTTEACTAKNPGITVVVEYPEKSQTFCVNHQGQSGWDLLNQIGAQPAGTAQYPVGFVCKLFNFPKTQDCKDTPQAAEGTWNYFVATAAGGNNWVYSPIGASTRKPNCGDFEAWVFAVPTSLESANPPASKAEPFSCQ